MTPETSAPARPLADPSLIALIALEARLSRRPAWFPEPVARRRHLAGLQIDSGFRTLANGTQAARKADNP